MDRSTPADGDGRIAASPVARSLTWVIEQNWRIAANAVPANQRNGNARNEEAGTAEHQGDLMHSKTRENGEFQWAGWVVGGASLLLLISAGLELFVQQTLGHNDVATVILALYLALWSYVLGLGVLLILAMWCLVEWRRVRIKRAAMSRYSPAESRSQRLEKLELGDHQFIEKGVAPLVPSRSSRESEDRNKATSPSKVA